MSNIGLSRDNRNNLSSRIRSVPEFKPRKVSAVRDFPPGCGPNAKPLDLKLDSVKLGTSSGHKDKSLCRRESATCDFPPLCGPNAPQPTQEEQQMINRGKDCVDDSKKIEVETDATQTLRKNLERGALMETQIISQTESVDGVEKVEVRTEAVERLKTIRGTIGDGGKKIEVEKDATQTLRKNLERGALMEMQIISQTESVDGVEKVEVKTEAVERLKTIRGTIGEDVMKLPLSWRHNAVAKRSKIERDISGWASMKKKAIPVPIGNPGALILRDQTSYGAHDENLPSNSRSSNAPHDFDVSIPPKHSSHDDARHRVMETLQLFRSICKKLPQNEAKSENQPRRIDLHAAKIIKEEKKEVNTGKQILGEVPGIEVGDEFQYRVELAIVGIHRLYQTGIDSMKHNGISVANSVVDAGVYAGDKHNADTLLYSGHGGNIVGKNKQPEDQKLEKGNLALKNSISMKTPVRVVRGLKETNSSGKLVTTYVYDGLYTVDRYWQETGPHGKLVFMFELSRIPGQPKLRKKSKI